VAEPSEVEVFDLSPRVPQLRLEPGGYRIVHRLGRRHDPLQLYSDLTHVSTTERGFWLASQTGVFFARRSRFRHPDGPEVLARELVRRVAAGPGGIDQLRRMAAIEHRARHPRPVRATWVVSVLCVVAFALQLGDPFVEHVAAFDPLLARAGEWWRPITANFVHGVGLVPLHLVFNLIGLLGFGFLVERALGPARLACLFAVTGLAAMAASAWVRPDPVIGASGMVAGLAGAALCLELVSGPRLPAWWRLPRRLFIALLLLQAVIDYNVERIAGEAHIGGFAAGFVLTLAMGRAAVDRVSAGLGIRGLGIAATAGLVAAVAAATPLWSRSADALEHHARRMLAEPSPSPLQDNLVAWIMATESDASPEQMQAAVDLAERAVAETGRLDPDLLDTLAEAHFAAGDPARALGVIDEAIRLAPAEPYFWEQRRRFTGERAPDDRPAPPSLPWFFRAPAPDAPPLPPPEPEPDPEDSAVI
jgi:rhomboid protease GluP